MWLRLGPVAVDVGSRVALPPALLALSRAHPGDAVVRARIRITRDGAAGEAGPLRLRGDTYVGPGFALARPTSEAEPYVACVAGGLEVGASLAALLVDLARAGAAFLLLHAAALAWRGGAVLVIGPSGSGKSTLASRHPARAIASNAVLAWPSGDAWIAEGLPMTGRGDAAVRPGRYRVTGVLALVPGSARPPRAKMPLASAVALVASAEAMPRGAGTGDGPRVDLAASLARAVPVRVTRRARQVY